MAKGPSPPDPYRTAQAQAGANFTTAQQNAVMGNVNEYTPYGSKTYQQIGWDPIYDAKGKMSYAPRYSSTVQLSPDQQRLLGQQTGIQSNLGNIGLQQSSRLYGHLGKELNTGGLGDWAGYRRDAGATNRSAIERAMMGRWNTDAARANAAQNAQLAAQGLSPGSQGFSTVQEQQGRARTDALQQAYLASGAESRAAQQEYNQATSLMNNLRQGQLTERIALRNQPINEIMALLGAAGPATPQFQPFSGPTMTAPNIGQMIYDNYNTRSQQSQNAMTGLFGIGGEIAGALPWASIFASDRRLKFDIRPLGKFLAGVPLYFFRFLKTPILPAELWLTPQIGVMADEARTLHPDAVHRFSDGYDRVDYGLLNRRHNHG